MRVNIYPVKKTEQVAVAGELSPLQKEYRAFMKAKCDEAGIDHPFQGTPEEISDFMMTISEGWAEHKAKNGLA